MSRKKIKYKSKFFPFSAGIPWKIERGKYIIPEIDGQIWNDVLKDKHIIITAFGGILESFISLCAAEAIKHTVNNNKLSWIGNFEYYDFVKFQGLCTLSNIKITEENLKNYPVPIFFDKNDNAYFNILNNYLIRNSYWGKYPEKINLPIFEQIYKNVLIPWNNYTPNLRYLGTEFIDNLYKTGKFNSNKTKIISIILNDCDNNMLDWNIHNIKEFAQLVSNKGFKVVLFTKYIYSFYGSNINIYKYDFKNIMQTVIKSWMVLSNDINWLIISMMISKSKLISRKINGPLDLLKNAESLGIENDIFVYTKWISPIDVFNICEGFL